jgi:hypothetical protein
MKWIVSVHEENGHLEQFRVLGWSLDRPDIEFQFSKKIIVDAIKRGSEYRTAFFVGGQFVEGSDVVLVEHKDGTTDLRTMNNGKIADNLGSLQKF